MGMITESGRNGGRAWKGGVVYLPAVGGRRR